MMMIEALYGCQFAECAEEVSYPAHMLKMLNGAPVCEDCVDDMGKVDWLDLEKFVPPEQAKITDLQSKLDKAVEALKEVIKSSDQSGIPGYRQCWECADTNKISKQALTAIEGAKNE